MAPSKKKPVPTPRPKSDNDAIAESIPDEIAMPSAAAGVDSGDSDAERIHTAQIAGNRKKRGGSGGFQSMGLSYPVYNAYVEIVVEMGSISARLIAIGCPRGVRNSLLTASLRRATRCPRRSSVNPFRSSCLDAMWWPWRALEGRAGAMGVFNFLS